MVETHREDKIGIGLAVFLNYKRFDRFWMDLIFRIRRLLLTKSRSWLVLLLFKLNGLQIGNWTTAKSSIFVFDRFVNDTRKMYFWVFSCTKQNKQTQLFLVKAIVDNELVVFQIQYSDPLCLLVAKLKTIQKKKIQEIGLVVHHYQKMVIIDDDDCLVLSDSMMIKTSSRSSRIFSPFCHTCARILIDLSFFCFCFCFIWRKQ